MKNTLPFTIHETAELLKKKAISATELTRQFLARAKKSELNSYITVTEESALDDAAEADRRIAKGTPRSLIDGVPASLKDVYCTKGVRTTAASRLLENFYPPYDATTVKKLKAAGMVLTGKTNTDEFTCGGSTENSFFGPTKNPWDVALVAGGSSGGSAAAVAAGECVYSMGTDTGGSIRQPAAFCGVTGLKPTYGRISRFGVISMASSLDTIGPICRDVMDCAILLQLLAGKDVYDSTSADRGVPDYMAACRNIDISSMRIGIPKEYFIEGLNPEIEQTVRAAITELKKFGAKIVDVSLPHVPYGLAVYYIICPSEVSANMARYDGIRYGRKTDAQFQHLTEYYEKTRGEGFGKEMKRRIMIGTYALSAGYYDAYYKKAQQVRTVIKQEFESVFESVDCLAAPITPSPAFSIGEKISDPITLYLEDIFTVPANIAGIPAMSLPCGFSKNRLPIGLQLMAPQFGEETLLTVGAAYQRATDFHRALPA